MTQRQEGVTVNELGPIPVSRLKEESARVFDALENGRVVLISRHSEVVAVIRPATDPIFDEDVLRFATNQPTAYRELTAGNISQDSPSSWVNAAHDEGVRSFVTRNGKVLGVLTGLVDSQAQVGESHAATTFVEAQLAQFERANPAASIADVEKFTDAAVKAGAVYAKAGSWLPSRTQPAVGWGVEKESLVESGLPVLSLLMRSRALRAKGHSAEAHEAAVEAMRIFSRLAEREPSRSGLAEDVRRAVASVGIDYADSDPDLALSVSERLLETT